MTPVQISPVNMHTAWEQKLKFKNQVCISILETLQASVYYLCTDAVTVSTIIIVCLNEMHNYTSTDLRKQLHD